MKKILLLAMTMSYMVSCNSDSSELQNSELKNSKRDSYRISDELAELRSNALSDLNIGGTVNYNPEEGIVFRPKSPKGSGTTITIPPHALVDRNGNEISGPIKIDYIEIFSKEKMLVANTPTMGRISREGEEKGILISGGEFYINITDRENEVVELRDAITIGIETDNSDADSNGMILWNGENDQEGDLTWEETEDGSMTFEGGETMFFEGNQYNILISNSDNFGWCNVDKFFENGGNPTSFSVISPQGFTPYNSSVYVAVEGERNMLAQLDVFEPSTNAFSEHGEFIPEGLNCHIIFVSVVNGQYVYAIQSVSISPNAVYSFSSGNLTTVNSYQDLEDVISNLP